MEIKQKSKRQAMTNTFNRLMTDPREYTPIVSVAHYGEVEHCELCGAALDYSFHLMHFDDPDFKKEKSLRVGSDCIHNFILAFVPDFSAQLLLSIKKSVLTSKTGQFKANYPTLLEEMKQLYVKLIDYRKLYGGYFYRLEEIDSFIKDYKSLKRSEYLSKPKIEKFYLLKSKIDSLKLQELLEEHIKTKLPENVVPFEQDPDLKFLRKVNKNKEIYPIYTKNKMSNLEKQLYLERLREIIKNNEKRLAKQNKLIKITG